MEYRMPEPCPALSVRRLTAGDAPDIAALYRGMGRDGAWCGGDTVRALLEAGVWWGGFADGVMALCAAVVPSGVSVPQVAAMRSAFAPAPVPQYFLLPPAVLTENNVPAALCPLLARRLCPQGVAYAPAFCAALPVKAPAPLLAACFDAGLAAVRMRPLASLRPHYLLAPRAAPDSRRADDPLRRIYLPLADTLAVSRLLERGFCATALLRSPADPRTLICLE